jgi:hypothetical protein
MCLTLQVEGTELNATSAQLRRQGGLTWMWAHNCGTRLLSTGYNLKWFCMYKLWLVGVLGQSHVPFFKFIEQSNALIKAYQRKKEKSHASVMLLGFHLLQLVALFFVDWEISRAGWIKFWVNVFGRSMISPEVPKLLYTWDVLLNSFLYVIY